MPGVCCVRFFFLTPSRFNLALARSAVLIAGQPQIKIPDLVAFYEDRVIWIEAEQSKKSGVRNMKPLAQALLLAASGKMSEVLGLKPVEAAIIFDIDSHSNHSARVRKAISEYSKKTINLHLIECKIIRHGVAEINIKTDLYIYFSCFIRHN